MTETDEKSAAGSTARHSASACDTADASWPAVRVAPEAGVAGAAAASSGCVEPVAVGSGLPVELAELVGAVLLLAVGAGEVVAAGDVVVVELGDDEPVGDADGLEDAWVVGEADGLDGLPMVTDCPVLPVVVVVVVPSDEVVVVVVPPVLVVTGHDTDLALITTPGPKLQVLLGLLDGLALAEGLLADGLGAAGVGVTVTGALVAVPGRMTTRRVVTVRCVVVTGADG